MRNIVLGVGTSLDGYIARPSGAVDFLFVPKDYSMASFFSSIDTALMGRKTFDAALQLSGGSFGSSTPTFVFSRSEAPGERKGVVFTNESPAAFVRQLRKGPGKDIWLMGAANSPATSSRQTWSINSIWASFRYCSGKAFRSSPPDSPNAISISLKTRVTQRV
jgi:hypothetical protein